MKTIRSFFYRLFDSNFDNRIKNARSLATTIKDSTAGGSAFAYNYQGDKIRGTDYRTYRSSVVEHPLIAKYK